MLQWKSLFANPEDRSAEQVRQLLASHPPGYFQLIDVRQPGEYRDGHVPGADLIPLKELPDRLDDLDRQRSTIVYCRSGVRSRSACQLLSRHGFRQVYNLQGGLLRWQGKTVEGGPTKGLEYFVSGNYENGVAMAYNMEAGLQRFYLEMAEAAEFAAIATLLEGMAKMEDGHMAKLQAMHGSMAGHVVPPDSREAASERNNLPLIEGACSLAELKAHYGDALNSQEDVINLAMGFEAEAYDLYSRLSRLADSEDMRTLFLSLANEERKHLDNLSRQLEDLKERATIHSKTPPGH